MEEVGGYEPQLRDRPRWEVQESIPGEKLRPGAYKMQLRPEEEEELPLVRVTCARWFGQGALPIHLCSLL